MNDEPVDGNGDSPRGRPGASGGLGELHNAVREILVAVGEDPAGAAASAAADQPAWGDAPEPSGGDSPDNSFDAKHANRWDVQSKRSSRFRLPSGHLVNLPTLLFLGAVSALVVLVTVSFIAVQLGRGNGDVVAKDCVSRDFGAEATVVVTNHGHEAASYLFNVAFSQSQAADSGSVSVPYRLPTLPVGGSRTVSVYSDLHNSTGTPACRITNVQRLPGK